MKHLKSTAVTSIAGLLFVLTLTTAKATIIEECVMTVDALEAATAGAEYLSNNPQTPTKDRDRLLARLAEVELKLQQGKFADAIQKLEDYRAKVVTLVMEGKLLPVDGLGADQMADGAGGLEGGAAEAIACVSGLG